MEENANINTNHHRRRLKTPKISSSRRISPAPGPVHSFLQLDSKTEVEPENIQIPIQQRFSQISTPSRKPSSKVVTKKDESTFDEETFRRQAANAKYMFSSDIDDSINGNLHKRAEIREGNNVRGKYSYSDGFFKRTVNYEADDKGFRIVK